MPTLIYKGLNNASLLSFKDLRLGLGNSVYDDGPAALFPAASAAPPTSSFLESFLFDSPHSCSVVLANPPRGVLHD